MDGVGGQRGWQHQFTDSSGFFLIIGYKIFILEGLLTVVVSVGAYFVVPTWSYKAKFVGFIPIKSDVRFDGSV